MAALLTPPKLHNETQSTRGHEARGHDAQWTNREGTRRDGMRPDGYTAQEGTAQLKGLREMPATQAIGHSTCIPVAHTPNTRAPWAVLMKDTNTKT